MPQQRHVIKQQILELQIDSEVKAFELQNRISALYRSQVVPLIEAYCDRLSDADSIYRIDRLEIDLGEIELAALETDFVQKIAASLAQQLSQQRLSSPARPADSATALSDSAAAALTPSAAPLKNPTVRQTAPPISPKEADFELLQDFIHTGRFPWWCQVQTQSALQEGFTRVLADLPTRLKALLKQALVQERPRQRILYQFSEQMLAEMLKLLLPGSDRAVQAYFSDMQRLRPHIACWQGVSPARLRQMLWQGLGSQLALSSAAPPRLETLLQSNLWQIAAQLQLEKRSLVQQLLEAIESRQQAGERFASELPLLLRAIAQPQSAQVATASTRPNPAENLLQTPAATAPALKNLERLLSLLTQLRAVAAAAIAPLGSRLDSLVRQTEALRQRLSDRPLSVLSHSAIASLRQLVSQLDQLVTQLEESAIAATLPPVVLQVEQVMAAIASTITTAHPPSFSAQDSDSFPPDESIYINNSGLVLLWPLLSRFLATLGLVESGQFITPEAAPRAALLLQHLVDGSTESLEASLPLNKLLCGLSLGDPIPYRLDLTETERDESEQLLLAVIQNWSALKNISTDGLRRAFLQRPGLLRRRQDGWLLQVEHQTHDILLDRLPWSIRIVKLPWMLTMLQVEWFAEEV
ncbi:contractile injection system tape measure protein [Sphaerothrix gracilis]|uniref:contractile injection system tape measure protein n=1 Tax=Sphaerothrix gracilis TaxID=3151835 RepID=UPI0031FD2602